MNYNKLYKNLLLRIKDYLQIEKNYYSQMRTYSNQCNEWEVYVHSSNLLEDIINKSLNEMNEDYLSDEGA